MVVKSLFIEHVIKSLCHFLMINFVLCNDIPGVLMKLGVTEYSPDDWRLFIGSSKRSLKCGRRHITNVYGSIPICHSAAFKEQFDTMKSVLQHIKYNDHQWVICLDLKMVNFLYGQQEIPMLSLLLRQQR